MTTSQPPFSAEVKDDATSFIDHQEEYDIQDK
jgi:hypothetical protein